MFKKVTSLLGKWWFKFKRFFFSIEVEADVVSPQYGATVKVYGVLFGGFRTEVDSFRVGFDEYYNIKFDKIYRDVPVVHRLYVSYPDGWTDTREDLLREKGLTYD